MNFFIMLHIGCNSGEWDGEVLNILFPYNFKMFCKKLFTFHKSLFSKGEIQQVKNISAR